MADIVFHEVEKGPSFATFQGPLCVLRLDWNGGNLRAAFAGSLEGGAAQALIARWEAILRTAPGIVVYYDFWEATGYETAYRVDTTQWVKKNPGKIREFHILSRSKILNMGISVAALAVPNVVIKTYGKRADFDILAKKAGLPLNQPMPQLVPQRQI